MDTTEGPCVSFPSPDPTPQSEPGSGTPPETPKPRRSGGPRTPAGKRRSSLNAVRHCARARSYVESIWHNMSDLGEDPREFRDMLGLLIKAHQPTDAAQMMLVEEIASLRWQRRRNERAQSGLVALNLESMVRERERRAMQIERRPDPDARQQDVLDRGLLYTEDCPTKFIEALRWIDLLSDMAKRLEFAEAAPTLQFLYGKNPAMRGVYIVGLFRGLAERQVEVRRDSAEYKDLARALAGEESEVLAEYALYCRENVEVTRAMREEAMAPAGSVKWRLLIRQLTSIDRQIERKTRLLLAMQRAARRTAKSRRKEAKSLMEMVDPGRPEPQQF